MIESIPRLLTPKVIDAHKFFPVVVITGPRQSGKTFLARHSFPSYNYVNLEDITLRSAALSDPPGFLDSLGRFAIIDEVQNVPDLLSMIQVRCDEDSERRYVLTGSSDFSLLKSVTQSLSGRAALFTLLPFSLREINPYVPKENIDEVILRGLYPQEVVKKAPLSMFYGSYYTTYVERDLRNLLNVKNIVAFDRFMRLLASRIGSEFNSSSMAREVGVSSVTISEWLSLLQTSYIVFVLRPYFKNAGKQYVKMSKVYFYDTGLACYLLGIRSVEQLRNHNLRGSLFENLAVTELLKRSFNAGEVPVVNFYRDKSGLEVDVLMNEGGGLRMYEIKSGETYNGTQGRNMEKLKREIEGVTGSTVIYNGPTIGNIAVNIHDI